MASENRTNRITGDWYRVGNPAVIGALGSALFDYSNLSNVVSDATTLGKTPMAIAQAIVINHSGTYAVAAADIAVADIQRISFYRMNQQIPNLKNKYFLEDPSLGLVRQIGMMMNPAAVAFDSLLPVKKRQFNPFDSIPTVNGANANAVIPNPDVNKRPNLLTGWRDDENMQQVQSILPAPFDFNDVVTLPFCNFSGNVANDRIPLTMLTDPSNPWKVTISEQSFGGLTIRGNQFATTAHTVTAELWVYIQFLDNDSSISIGNVYCVQNLAFTSGQTIDPHRYKFYGMRPNYNSTTLDGGVAVPYLPFNYQTAIDDNNVRVFNCTKQVFPLPQFSAAERTITHCNIGASQNANPWYYYQPDGTSTIIHGVGSALPGVTANWYPLEVRGCWSGVPFFPLLMNHLSVHAFPPNIIASPGCEADYRVQIDGSGGTPGGQVIGVYLDDYYEDDIKVMENYAVNGKMMSNFDNTAWRPLIDNPDSPKSRQAIGLVPVILNRG